MRKNSGVACRKSFFARSSLHRSGDASAGTGPLLLVLCVSTPVYEAASEAQIKQFTRTERAVAAGGAVTPQRLPHPGQVFWDGQEVL